MVLVIIIFYLPIKDILMKKITGCGLVAGTIVWLVIMWYATTRYDCLKTNSCDGGDLLLSAVIGIGMLAPSWIVASLVSSIFGPNK